MKRDPWLFIEDDEDIQTQPAYALEGNDDISDHLKPVNLDNLKVLLRRAAHVRQLERESVTQPLQMEDVVRLSDIQGPVPKGHPHAQPAPCRALHLDQLQRRPGDTTPEQALRPRGGSFTGARAQRRGEARPAADQKRAVTRMFLRASRCPITHR
jgi:hypothetical protein